MLLVANQRLYELRRQRKETAVSLSSESITAPSTFPEQLASLPAHLGWESSVATQSIRGKAPLCEEVAVRCAQQASLASSSLLTRKATIKHYPSLGIAAIEAEETAVLRVWLACRHLDEAGRGWLALDLVREQLTEKTATLRLCGKRRLRQILRAGNGRFWTRSDEQLWLHGVARVAATLDVTKLSGRPVQLPITALTEGIGAFRAHLYAAWHSGRRYSNPIARRTQRELTHVPERTQRRYCRQAKVRQQRHFGIGEQYNKESIEERAWQQGQATFKFTDQRNRLGLGTGASYIAWQLPNSYIGPHEPSQQGRQRKLQRQLTDLVNQGARGNSKTKQQRRYYPDGKAAIAANDTQAYWPAEQGHEWQFWFAPR